MRRIKEIALTTLTVPGLTSLFTPLLHGRATIFMLHRFRDPDRGVEGIDPAVVESGLSYLRRHRYELIGLEDLFSRLAGDGPPLRRAVAFTIDDGYLEQATIAAPLFARYDCPVTTFVTTDFLDGRIWLWWDRLEYVFQHARRRELAARLDGADVRYSWGDDAGRRRAYKEFNLWCTRQPDALKHAVIAAAARSAEVEIPAAPPSRYVPMSWDLLRACEKRGMSFGPHTLTHPILSRTAAEHSRREVTDSWNRLRAEASRPVPVFCYPNGCWDDFGAREIAVLEELGFCGAVVGENGYADARTLQKRAAERFRVQRFPYPEDLLHVIQIVSGFERLKQIIRREAAA